MKILVTNDDGIHAPGLWSLVRCLVEIGQVTVVAPDRDKSGVGSGMTLLDIVRTQEVTSPVEGVVAHSVEGTPSDCVILAAEKLVSGKIDLVVSGINQGSNLGLDVLNSGTVGGAFHGYFRGIPSIAISVAALRDVKYDTAARTAKIIAESIFEHALPAPLLLNVNLPNVALEAISSVEITRLGPKLYLENVSQESNGRRTYYWIRHNKPTNSHIEDGMDIKAVQSNKISITPVDLLSQSNTPSTTFQVIADDVATALNIGATA